MTNRRIQFHRTIVRILMVVALGLVGLGVWGQSRIPAESTNWLQVTGQAGLGSRSLVNVTFFEVPDTVTGTLFFAVNDPSLDDVVNPVNQGSGETSFRLYGGSGALSNPDSRRREYPAGSQALANAGTLLASMTEAAGTGWVYFAGVDVTQGEKIGNRYYFKVVVEAEAGTNQKNAYQLDVSFSNSGNPTGAAGIRAFAYSWTVNLSRNPDVNRVWNLYPFVPDGDVGSYLVFSNWDFDENAATITNTGTWFNPAETSNGGVTSSNNNQFANTSVLIGAGEDSTTWWYNILSTNSDGGAAGIMTGQIWHSRSAASVTGNVDYPGVSSPDLYRTYAAPYTPDPPDHVAIALQDGVAKANDTDAEIVTLQIVDAEGTPVPFVRAVYVQVSGNARINAGAAGAPALLTTGSDGLVQFELRNGTAQTVTITLTTDGGANGSSNLTNTQPNQSAQVVFSTLLPPTLNSASNTTLNINTANVGPLANIVIAATETGSPNTTDGIRIRLPAGITDTFLNNGVTPGTAMSGAGAGAVGAPVFEGTAGQERVLYIPVTVPFDAGRIVTISNVRLNTGAVEAAGRLQLSVAGAGDAAYTVEDSRVLTVTNTSAHVWWGSTSTDWSVSANWNTGTVPGAGAIVVIPPAVNQPILSVATANLGGLTLQAGATLNTNGQQLNVTGPMAILGNLIGGGPLSFGASSIRGNITSGGGNITFTGPITLTGATTINSGTGTITFEPLATINGTQSLTVTSIGAKTFGSLIGTGPTTQPTIFTVSGTGLANLSAGTISVGGSTTVFSSPVSVIGDTTISDASSVTFESTVAIATGVRLTVQTPIVDFQDPVTGLGEIALEPYTPGGTLSLSGTSNFAHTGGLVLGNDASDVIDGDAEDITYTAGPTTLQGTLQTSDQAITLGPVTLGSNSVITSQSTATNSANIVLGAVTGGGFALTLTSGGGIANADVTGTSVAGVSTLTLEDIGGTVTFTGAVSAANLVVDASVENASFTGASGTITNLVDFQNTGTLTLGQDGGDLIFNGGVNGSGVGGTVTLNGVIRSNDDPITFGDITLGSSVELDTQSTGTNLADLSLGVVTGGGFNLTLDTAHLPGADITLDSGSDIGTFTIRDAGTARVTGALGATTIAVTDAATLVDFQGPLTATALTIPTTVTPYEVSLTGDGTVITNPVTFGNTGVLTLGQAPGTLTFSGGVTATAPSSINLAGTIQTANTLLTLGDIDTGIILTDNTQLFSDAGLGDITLGGTIDGPYNLEVNAGTGSVLISQAIGGTTPLGDGPGTALEVSGSGGITIAGVTIRTDGDQVYNNPVTLTVGPVTLETSDNDGSITFQGTVTGAQNLNLVTNGTGQVVLNGDVTPGATPADALSVTSAGLILDLGVDINTSGVNGNITLTIDDLILTGVNTINAGTGTITLSPSTVTHTIEYGDVDTALVTDVYYSSAWTGFTAGSFSLGSATHTGNIYLSGTASALSPLTVQNAGGGSISVIGNYVRDNVANDRSLTLNSGTGGINLGAAGPLSLSLGSGSLVAQDPLLVTGGGGVGILASGGVTFDSTLGAVAGGGNDLTITAGVGDVTFTGLVTLADNDLNVVSSDIVMVTGGISGTIGSLDFITSSRTDVDGTIGLTGAGTVTLEAATISGVNVTTVGGNISFNGAVNLDSGPVSIGTGAGLGNILFGSTVDGDQALTVASGTGSITFSDSVGSTLDLASLTITNSAALTFGDSLRVTGALTQTNPATGPTIFDGPVTVGSATLHGTDFAINDSFTANLGAIAITNTGIVTKNDTGIISTTTAGTGTITTSGALTTSANITTNGSNIEIGGNLVLGQDTDLTLSTGGAAAGSITITGTTNGTAGAGPETITLIAGTGNVTLTGAVGGVEPLETLIVTNATQAEFGANVTTTGSQSITATTIRTSGTHQTTDSDLNLDGNLVLLGDTFLTTGGGVGDILVTGTIDAITVNTQTLGLTAGTGIIDLQGDIGATALGSLTVNSGTVAQFGGDVITAGAQTVTAGTIRTNGTHSTTNSNVTLTGILDLQGSTVINTGAAGGDVVLSSTVDAAVTNGQGLTVNAGTGTISITGPVGETRRLAHLRLETMTGGFTAPSLQVADDLQLFFGGPVTQLAAPAFLSGTTLHVRTRFDGGAGITLANPGNDFTTLVLETRNGANTADAAGSISYRDATGFALGALGALGAGIRTTADTRLQAGTGVTQTGQVISGGLELLGTGPYTLTNVANNITTLAANLTGLGTALSYTDANTVTVGTVGTAGITTNGGTVTLTNLLGNLQVNNPITTGVGAGTIVLDSVGTLGVAAALTSGTGNISLDSGGLTTVTAGGVITTGTGAVSFGAIRIGTLATAGNVTTAGGAVRFYQAVELTGNVSLDTTNAGTMAIGANIQFDMAVTRDGMARDLNLRAGTAGNVVLPAAVGIGGAPLGAMTIVSANNIAGDTGATVNAGAITAASFTQSTGSGTTRLGTVTLSGAMSLIGNAMDLNGAIVAPTGFSSSGTSFDSTGASITTTDNPITVTHSGDVIIGGALTSGAGAVDIDATGAGATITLNSPITTTTGNVSLDSEGLTTIAATGDITTTTGTVIFGGARPGLLSTAGDVTTGGGLVTYTRGTTLTAGPVTITTGPGAGAVTFEDTLNGAQALTIDAGTGAVSFGGAVGAPGLTSITVTNSGALSFNAGLTVTGALTQTNPATGPTIFDGPVTVGSGTLRGTTYEINNSFTSSGSIAITNSGLVTKNATGIISTTTAGTGTITTSGALTNAANITTDGSDISIGGNLVLSQDADITLSTGVGVGGSITVTGTTNGTAGLGPENLTLIAGTGNVTLTGAVGNGVPLGTLTVSSATTSLFSGNLNLSGNLSVTSLTSTEFGANVTTTGSQNITATTIRTTGTHQTSVSDLYLTGNLVLLGDTILTTGGGAGDITVTGTINADTANTETLSLTAGTGTIDLQGNIGATALGSLTVNSGTSVRFGGDVNTGGAQAVTAGNILTNGTHTTSDANISFTGPLVLQNNTTINTGAAGGDITFSTTVNADLATNNRILTLNSGTGEISFGAGVGTTEALNHVRILGAENLTGPGPINLAAQDLYLDANGFDVNLERNLTVRRFVFYSGELDVNGQTITTIDDFVVFGSAYNSFDDDRVGGNTFFAYPGDVDLVYYPGGGTYVDKIFDPVPSATFADLENSVITVGGNFYVHGTDLPASNDWFLNIPPNDGVPIAPNNGFGATYAVLLRSSVAYGQVSVGIVNATVPSSGHTNNGVTNGGNNTNWNFLALEIISAQTVYDDVIRVTFNQPIANENDEILLAVNSINITNPTIVSPIGFAAAYTAMELDGTFTTLTTGAGNPTTIYLQLDPAEHDHRWNTDATGLSPGDPGSTDRGRPGVSAAHRDSIPNLSMLKGLLRGADGNVMGINYGPNGFALFDGTTDEAAPVLISVQAGVAPHTKTAQSPYDAHNYLHLRYSEPVNLHDLTPGLLIGGTATNLRATLNPGAGDGVFGGDFREDGTDVLISGFIRYPGSILTGSRDGNDVITSVYRQVGLNPSGNHGITFVLAGYSTPAGVNTHHWPGYIYEVTNPVSEPVTVVENTRITDAANRQLEHDGPVAYGKATVEIVGLNPANVAPPGVVATPMPPYNTVAHRSGWDDDPPVFSVFVPGSPPTYEIVARSTVPSGLINRLEFFIRDNGTEPWDPNNDHPESGSFVGIRDSSFTFPDGISNKAEAFTVFVEGSAIPVQEERLFTTDIANSLFQPNAPFVINQIDDPYFTITISEDFNFGPLSRLVVRYDYQQAYITDLAGNLLRTAPDEDLPAIDPIPPQINIALSATQGNRIYLLFDKPAYGDLDGDTIPQPGAFEVLRSGLPETVIPLRSSNPIEVIRDEDQGKIARGVWEMYLYLEDTLTADDLVDGRIRIIGGELFNDLGISNPTGVDVDRPLSDIATGTVIPIFALDGYTDELSRQGQPFQPLRNFDGTGTLRDQDITLQAQILAPGFIHRTLTLLYDGQVPTGVKSQGGFWSPRQLLGFTPRQNLQARIAPLVSISNDLRTFRIPSSDPEMVDGNQIEFIFELEEKPVGWVSDVNQPLSVRPWSFRVGGVITQRAGVTIVNNVINPIAGDTTALVYSLDTPGMVTISVFTLDGSLVRMLQRGPQAAGSYTVTWNGTNAQGQVVARGVYMIRIVGPGIDEFRRVLVVRP
jgi:hypothetical protein